MDQPTAVPEVSEETKLSRRRLLKIAAATGGAVAASTLIPSKWAKPVVDVGLLPAHAQMSIREAFWTGETEEDCCGENFNGGHMGYIMQTEFYLCFDEDSHPGIAFEFSGGTDDGECVEGLGPCNGAKSLHAFTETRVRLAGCELFCDLWCVYFGDHTKVTINLLECETVNGTDAQVLLPEDCKVVSSVTLKKPD